MNHKRVYNEFIYKEAVFRICCNRFEAVTWEIVRQRYILEEYIQQQPAFKDSFIPLEILADAPESVQRMSHAAALVGVGPMAAVAGTMAQLAAEAVLKAGAEDVIVENGGDIYLAAKTPVAIGLFSGQSETLHQLGFEVRPEDTPIAICSSSGKMGHSTSLGQCDLATIVAKEAALADVAATQAANLVSNVEDVDATLNRIAAIDGVKGVLIVKDGHVGLAGKLPRLIKCEKAAPY